MLLKSIKENSLKHCRYFQYYPSSSYCYQHPDLLEFFKMMYSTRIQQCMLTDILSLEPELDYNRPQALGARRRPGAGDF